MGFSVHDYQQGRPASGLDALRIKHEAMAALSTPCAPAWLSVSRACGVAPDLAGEFSRFWLALRRRSWLDVMREPIVLATLAETGQVPLPIMVAIVRLANSSGETGAMSALSFAPDLEPGIMEALARHGDPDVRYLLAIHPSASPYLLEQLTLDVDNGVAKAARTALRNRDPLTGSWPAGRPTGVASSGATDGSSTSRTSSHCRSRR